MLNPNTLYTTVFKPSHRKFDTTKDYFTVLIDTPEFAPLYPDVSSRLESMMNHAAYLYFHSEKPSDIEQITMDERMSDVIEHLDTAIDGEPPAKRYCILSYFDEEHKDVNALVKMLGYLTRDPKDVVTLMVCISKRMSHQNEFLNELSSRLFEKASYVDLYVFSDGHTSYYRRSLTQSICGAVIMNSEIASYKERTARKRNASTAIGNFISAQLSDDGRNALSELPALRWSTFCCKHYDRQYDFLNKYLSDVCQNLRHLDNRYFFEAIEELYRTIVPSGETKDVKSILNQAIRTMPYVVESVPKGSVRTLNEHFNSIYGYQGASTVDLTLKATLSGIFRYRNEEYVKKCCTLIFEKCSGFAEENLYEQISSMLAQYIDSLNKSCEGIKSSLKLILDEDFISEHSAETINHYLEKYIQLYQKQKAAAFWIEAQRHIQTYPENYEHFCKKACEYHCQMEELVKNIPTSRVYHFDDVELKTFTAEEILTMDQNEELCSYVHTLFNSCKDDGQGTTFPDSCSTVFALNIDPNFYRSSTVKLETPSYTLCGCEYNGQYFVYIGGEKDV